MFNLAIVFVIFVGMATPSWAQSNTKPLKEPTPSLGGVQGLDAEKSAPMPRGDAPQAETPPLRANKASLLTQTQVRDRIVPQLEKGMTEAQLQKALGTLPVLIDNGELLWALKDGLLLTASDEGKPDSQIVCWGIRPIR